MSWLCAERRVFDTLDTSHCVRRALLAGTRANVPNQGLSHGDIVCVWRKRITPKRTQGPHLRHIAGMNMLLLFDKRTTMWSCRIGDA